MDRDVRSNLILTLLTIFILMWTYTEVSEYFERENFTHEVTDFMYKGDRFTSEDGDRLCTRVRHLELEHHQYDGGDCK